MSIFNKILSELEPYDLDFFTQDSTASISSVVLQSGTTYRVTFGDTLSNITVGMVLLVSNGDNDGVYRVEAVGSNYVDVDSDVTLLDQTSSAIFYKIKGGTVNRLIAANTEYLERVIGVSLSGTEQRVEYHDGGSDEIILDRKNVNSIDDISIIGRQLDYAYESSNADVLPGTGVIRLKGNYEWPSGHNNVKVTYTSGYTAIPDDLQDAIVYLACSDLLRADANHGGSPVSLSVVSYSESFGEGGLYSNARKSYRHKANNIIRKYKSGVVG